MPRWDFYCEQCDEVFELSFDTYEQSRDAECPDCRCNMEQGLERLPAAPSFTVRGYNAKNGYAK